MADRQSGLTTKQMQDAPRGSLFVWCNGLLGYPRRLAQELGRDDLRIVAPHDLCGQRLAGLEFPAAILDHAARLTYEEWQGWEWAQTRVRPSIPRGSDG